MTCTLKAAAICLILSSLNVHCASCVNLQMHQQSPPCDPSALDSAEKLRKERTPDAARMALPLYREALRCSVSDEEKAEILLNIGRIQAQLDNSTEAIDSFSSSLALFRQIREQTAEVQKKEAASLVNLGRLLHDVGRIDDALSSYNEALPIFHHLNEKAGEAYALQELGRANYLMGDNENALKYYGQALDIRNAIDPADEVNQQFKAALLDETGRVYARTQQSGMAESYFQDALILARKTSYHRFIAYTLNDLGIQLLKQNKPDGARKHHEASLLELQQYEPENLEG